MGELFWRIETIKAGAMMLKQLNFNEKDYSKD